MAKSSKNKKLKSKNSDKSSEKSSHKHSGKDPHRAREANKYEHPIPSREFILSTLEAHGAPLKFDQLARQLKIKEKQRDPLDYRLRAMCRDGQLVRNRRAGYCPVTKADLIVGRVIGHQDGFGFLRPDEGGDDLFMSPRQMRTLWHDDRAVVQVTGIDRRGRREGTVVEVIERAHQFVVGRMHVDSGVGFLVPDNKRMTHDIVVPDDLLNGAKDGQMVVVEITEQPAKYRQPIGQVSEIHFGNGLD